MSESYEYQGKQVVVTPVPKTDQPETWDVTIRIDGVLYPLIKFGTHPPKLFPSSKRAVEYGKEAAQYIIDHPISGTTQ